MDANAANDKYSGRLRVNLAPSRRVARLCAMGGLATVGVIIATPLPTGVGVALGTFVACLTLDAVRRALAPHRLAIELGEVLVDGRAGSLRAGSFVAPWLAILRWRPAGARFDRTLLVSPDRLSPADFRHLRVIVKNAIVAA